jgi:hypothetical protein
MEGVQTHLHKCQRKNLPLFDHVFVYSFQAPGAKKDYIKSV